MISGAAAVLLAGNLAAVAGESSAVQDALARSQTRQVQVLRGQVKKPYPEEGLWHYEDVALGAY